MNIAFVTSGEVAIPPVNGGAVENLVDMFLKYNDLNKKNQIKVYGLYDAKAENEIRKYNNTIFCLYKNTLFDNFFDIICRLGNKFLRKVYFPNSYVNKVKKNIVKSAIKFDYIIMENCPLVGLTLKDSYNEKLILHLHNDFLNNNTKLSREVFSCYKSIYTVSNFLKKQVATISLEDKVKVLYNGVNIEEFGNVSQNEIDKYRQDNGINKNDIVIMYCGRIVPEKGIKELVCAYQSIKTNKSTKLIIVGDMNPNININRKYCEELKNIALKNNSIIFTGKINYSQIALQYNIANIGVIPTICEEGFALTVVENKAAGNPVIISDSGGMIELVNNDIDIIVRRDKEYITNLTKAIDKMINVYCDIDKKVIIEHSKMFSCQKYCENFEKLLCEEEINGKR